MKLCRTFSVAAAPFALKLQILRETKDGLGQIFFTNKNIKTTINLEVLLQNLITFKIN